MNRQISLVGAPTDIGAGAAAPAWDRRPCASRNIVPVLESHGLDVVDRGNLNGPANPWQPPVNGYRHLHEAVPGTRRCTRPCTTNCGATACRSCSGAITASAIGSISAVARHCRETGKKLRVLWIDSHADFNTNTVTPTGNIHGMPVACLCGQGPQELIEIGGDGAGDQPAGTSGRSGSGVLIPARSAGAGDRNRSV